MQQKNRNALIIILVICLTQSSSVVAQNQTFPKLISIADRIANSSKRLADVAEESNGPVKNILTEVILLNRQVKETSDLIKARTEHAYVALGTFIVVSIAVSIGGLFVATRHLINKRLQTATQDITTAP